MTMTLDNQNMEPKFSVYKTVHLEDGYETYEFYNHLDNDYSRSPSFKHLVPFLLYSDCLIEKTEEGLEKMVQNTSININFTPPYESKFHFGLAGKTYWVKAYKLSDEEETEFMEAISKEYTASRRYEKRQLKDYHKRK